MRRFLFLALCPTLCLTLLACGGQSDQDYFRKVVAIREQRDAGMQALQSELSATIDSDADKQAQLDAFRDVMARSVDVDRRALEQLDDLQPPDDAGDAHDAFVTAYGHSIDETQKAIEASSDTKTLGAMFEILGNDDATAAIQALNDACLQLQAVADGQNIQANLSCQPAVPPAGG